MSPRRAARFFLAGLLSLLAPLGVLWAPPSEAHSFSRGQSRFTVEETGAVSVLVELREEDVLDVFDVDLSSEAEEPRLVPILEEMLPKLLKLRGDGALCPLADMGFTRRGVRTIQLRATARCRAPPTELILDWGFGSQSSLELVSYAQVLAPGGIEHVTVLSKKENRRIFRVGRESFVDVLPRRGPRGVLVGAPGALVLLAALTLAGAGRRGVAAGAFGLGGVTAGLSLVVRAEHAEALSALGPLLVGVAGIGLAAGPALLAASPLRLRMLVVALAMLGGVGTGIAGLVVVDLGGDAPVQAVLAQSLGALVLPFAVGATIAATHRRLEELGLDRQAWVATLAGALAGAGAVAVLLLA